MLIERAQYLNALIKKQWNGRIKIVTGIRRCGKSTLLLELFRNHLIDTGVPADHIISLELDSDIYQDYRDPRQLSAYIHQHTTDNQNRYYVLLDEIQYAISRDELKNKDNPPALYSVLNGLLHQKNIDVYVTGSNSKMLSKDITTEFRGRGDVVQINPFSFHEYYHASHLDKYDAYNEYAMFGGMPYLLHLDSDNEKFDYLVQLFDEIYFKDIEERYDIALPGIFRELTFALCSSVGSLTNASKIARTLKTTKNMDVNSETISKYLNYLTESFLFREAVRYDIKGKKYFEYPSKYYCTDVGLRNCWLGLRQQEETHIMENIIYNELVCRGFLVDVGVVPLTEKDEAGKRVQKNCEIDFIARRGEQKYYIQSALSMDDPQKEKTELRPLLKTNDSFQKLVISKTYGKRWTDDNGILHINLLDFLLDDNIL
ncbi:MAG: ATP-binding protein [Proteobacteria bacterium]|nr:ATP-binding protein [Pseudomonadota bacterium]